MVDSLLASVSNNGNTIELSASDNGQGLLPRKKEKARELQRRVKILKGLLIVSSQSKKKFEDKYSLDDDTSVKIDYVKQATDILDTLDAHDWYESLEKDLKELEGLLYNNWEDEYGDEMMEAYDELIFTINTTTSNGASTPKNIINTQETDKIYFVHDDNTLSGKETKIHDNIKSNKNIKSNDKALDNVLEATNQNKTKMNCLLCSFETAKIKRSKAK